MLSDAAPFNDGYEIQLPSYLRIDSNPVEVPRQLLGDVRLASGGNVIKLSQLVTHTLGQTKLECFATASMFTLVQYLIISQVTT
jgi:hypothetical protein